MKTKLHCILLIDDHKPTNYYHKLIIEEAECTKQTVVAESGQAALDYLTSSNVLPDLIFLDINMPGMNGWEFLREFQKLRLDKKDIRIMMLTTSLSPKDKEQLMDFPFVAACKIKPLTVELLQEVFDEHFSKKNQLSNGIN